MPQASYDNTLLTKLTGFVREYAAVEITLSDSTILRYAEMNSTLNGHAYTNNLAKVGALKMSSTASVDRCDVQLFNADGNITPLIEGNLQLENAFVTVYRVIDDLKGTTNIISRFSGIIIEPRTDDEYIWFTVLSLTFGNKSIVGDRMVDRKCVHSYKDAECGYTGSLPTCDYTLDGANGCRTHYTDEQARIHYGGDALDLDEQTLRDLTGNNGYPYGSPGIGSGGGSKGPYGGDPYDPNGWRTPKDG